MRKGVEDIEGRWTPPHYEESAVCTLGFIESWSHCVPHCVCTLHWVATA